jgi:hypothetical protein
MEQPTSLPSLTLRYAVVHEDMQGLAASYDSVTDKSKKAEHAVVTHIMCSGQHASRQHRQHHVQRPACLYLQTSRDVLALHQVKLTVSGD